MTKIGRWVKAGLPSALAIVLIFIVSSVHSEILRNPDAKDDAKYKCDVPSRQEDKISQGYEMAQHKYDKNKLACAADILFQASNQAPDDIELAIGALAVNTDYIDQVAILKKADLAGLQEDEWALRLAHGGKQANKMIARLENMAPESPMVMALKGVSIILIHQFDSPSKSVASINESLELLTRATKLEPTVLGGEAMVVLGRIYYEIPTLFGGDSEKALYFYQKAYAQTPTNIQLLRFLAEYWDGEMEEEKATQALAEMLPLKPTFPQLQMFSDELRFGSGLADRLGKETLYEKLKQKRLALLADYPMLNSRKSAASAGHGGVDPITGKAQY